MQKKKKGPDSSEVSLRSDDMRGADDSQQEVELSKSNTDTTIASSDAFLAFSSLLASLILASVLLWTVITWRASGPAMREQLPFLNPQQILPCGDTKDTVATFYI